MDPFIFFSVLTGIAIVNISIIYLLNKLEIININLKDKDELWYILLLNIVPVIDVFITIALVLTAIKHYTIKAYKLIKH